MTLIQKKMLIIAVLFAVSGISVLFIFLHNGDLQGTAVYSHESTTFSVPKGMCLIPAGEFEMGINYPDASPNDEQPVYTVHVDAFFIDKSEVTNAEYKQFLIENSSVAKRTY